MMVPDYVMIAEILLYSYGYLDARSMARKLVQTYRYIADRSSHVTQSNTHYYLDTALFGTKKQLRHRLQTGKCMDLTTSVSPCYTHFDWRGIGPLTFLHKEQAGLLVTQACLKAISNCCYPLSKCSTTHV
jgi:hypothetical protein